MPTLRGSVLALVETALHQVIVQGAAAADQNRDAIIAAAEAGYDDLATGVHLGTFDAVLKPILKKQINPLVNAGINYLQKQAALPPALPTSTAPATLPAATPAAAPAAGFNF